LSQSLPILPAPTLADAPLPGLRPRSAEAGERAGQRQSFGRLLDRFTRNEAAGDAAKEPIREPTDGRTRAASETGNRPGRKSQAPTGESVPETQSAPTTPEASQPETLASAVAPLPAAPTAVLTPTLEPQVTGREAQPGQPPVATTETPIAAAVAPQVPQPQPDWGTPTALVAPTATAEPEALLPAEPLLPEPATAAPSSERTGTPAVQPQIAAATAAMPDVAAKPPARTGNQTPTVDAGDAGDAALQRATPVAANRLPSDAAEPELQAEQTDQLKSALPTAAAARAATVALGEPPAAGRGPEPQTQPAAFAPVDSLRSAAAQYHRVVETVRLAAEMPLPPAEQVSVRLLHAVAEGRRVIQMQLHPAELGSIDVRMHWQGERLSAQFLVDRPETLHLLQRDLPALERSLAQAGVNLDNGGLSFSLRQQGGDSRGQEGRPFAAETGKPAFDGADRPMTDEPLGQVIRDGLLSIRV
jgi:flagellar hook-length control protein FliK